MTQAANDIAKTAGDFGAGRIAFIHGLWHADIVLQAYEGFINEARDLGLPIAHVDRLEAPGAYELPLLAQRLARSGRS